MTSNPEIPAFQDTVGNERVSGDITNLWRMGDPSFRDLFLRFLFEFNNDSSVLVDDSNGDNGLSLYLRRALQSLRDNILTISVDVRDLIAWDHLQPTETGLSQFIVHNALFLMLDNHLHEIATVLLRKVIDSVPAEQVHDWEELFRRYIDDINIALVDWKPNPQSLRTLYCDRASELVTIKGTVTRVSPHGPELKKAYYECQICRTKNGPIIQIFKETYPTHCVYPECKNKRHWTPLRDLDVADDWQKVRIQENADEIPPGCLPRSMDVIMRGVLIDKCHSGDKVHLSGTLAVVPDVTPLMARGEVPKVIMREQMTANRSEMDARTQVRGMKGLGVKDLACRTTFIVTGVQLKNEHDRDRNEEDDQDDAIEETNCHRGLDSFCFKELSSQLQRQFIEISQHPNCLDILIANFLPRVYANDNIKKGLLLMLVGGIEKTGEKDNLRMRGDINLAIVGDPGTGKSMILRELCSFVPRSVYASGKMATAAGLTASVTRDREQTGNPVIEAGALMLADGGICCIDEFDKMDQKDMSAIHEAMEQQTISIAKAGVHAVLNARASVVAGLSPLFGRYNPQRSLKQNVNLTDPILSRFDLIFVIMDDSSNDEALAARILGMEEQYGLSVINMRSLNVKSSDLQEYIKVAKTLKPKLSAHATKTLAESYTALRQQDVTPGGQRHTRATVRQLESLVRLSEATARLHLSDEVLPKHVHLAFDLFQNSLTKLAKGTIDFVPEEAAAAEGAEGQENGEDCTKNQVLSIDETVFERIAVSVIKHLEELRHEKVSQNDFSQTEIIDDKLADWIVSNKDLFPDLDDTDETQLEEYYELVGRILRKMVEEDNTLIATTMIDEDGMDAKFVSLHPSTSIGSYLEAITAQNSRARMVAGNAVIPDEGEEEGDKDLYVHGEEDLDEEDRFGKYIEEMNK